MSDRNFLLYDRDNVHSAEGFIPEMSRQSLGTNCAISSIWDIASVAHFVTLSSSTFKASEYFLTAGFTSRLFTALNKGACRTYH